MINDQIKLPGSLLTLDEIFKMETDKLEPFSSNQNNSNAKQKDSI